MAIRKSRNTLCALICVLPLLATGSLLSPGHAEKANLEEEYSMNTTSTLLREAWAYYYEKVEDARKRLEETQRFSERDDHRAQGYHSLFEAQAMA